MILCQITDLHIKRAGRLAYRRVDTTAYLARCVARINALIPQPDAIIITGDLVDAGDVEEYTCLKKLLAPLTAPYYLVIGNHDGRAALRMIREVVEANAPPGSVPAEEHVEPPLV